MKKEEKTELTKERIIRAAIEEFGTKGYAAFVLNTVCSSHGIAKGLLYHNFNGKDDLYLACVSHCFSNVTGYLKKQDIQDDLEKYMRVRMQYFSENPYYARIFFEAVLQPPAALKEKIRERKSEFDQFNRGVYQSALSKITLREGITEKDAMEYYEVMQEMFNGYFSSPAYAGTDFWLLVADHEERLSKMLNLMLYGIGERSTKK